MFAWLKSVFGSWERQAAAAERAAKARRSFGSWERQAAETPVRAAKGRRSVADMWKVVVWVDEGTSFAFAFERRELALAWAKAREGLYAVEVYAPDGSPVGAGG